MQEQQIVLSEKYKLVDQLIIDSKDRDATSTSSTDFTVNVQYTSGGIVRIALIKAVIPLVYDNVTSDNNTFTLGGVGKTLDIGFYSITQLIQELNDVSSGYTWSWENQSRIKVLKDDLAVFAFVPGNAATLLGFTAASYGGVNNYVAELFPDLAENLNYLTLHSTELSKRSEGSGMHSDHRSNIVSIIPIVDSHGNIATWEPQFYKFFDVKDHHLSTIDIQLKKSDNTVVDLNEQNIVLVFNRYMKRT